MTTATVETTTALNATYGTVVDRGSPYLAQSLHLDGVIVLDEVLLLALHGVMRVGRMVAHGRLAAALYTRAL